jgi:heat shock protein HslJ
MKKYILATLLICSVLFSSCCSKKDSTTKENKTSFYNTIWVLEYISGTRIAFEGLYPESKPTLIFKEKEMTYGGNSSCNTYTGSFTFKDNIIQFGQTTQTMRYCEGGGEKAFFNMLSKVNKPVIDSDGKLLLLIDDIPMMRFKKKVVKP